MRNFVSVLSRKSKNEGFGLIWLHIKSETEPLDSLMQTFVDDVVSF
jgi:hypothetical protein